MFFKIGFIVSVAMALIQLPYVTEGSVVNILAMIYCLVIAVQMAMVAYYIR